MRYWLGPWVWTPNLIGTRFGWDAPAGTLERIDLRSLSQTAATGPVASGSGLFATADATALGAGYLEVQANLNPGQRNAVQSFLGLPDAITATTRSELLTDLLAKHSSPAGDTFARPLMPDRKGEIACQFGEHRIAFTPRPGMPQWAKIAAVYREDYRQIRTQHAGTPQSTQHRKFLSVISSDLGVDYHEFIPPDLPDETPLAPSTVITDNFNRADSATLGSSSEGWSWTEVLGDIDISGNTFVGAGGLSEMWARAESSLSSANQYAQVNLVEDGASPCVRFHLVNSDFYFAYENGGGARIFKNVGGTPTALTSAAGIVAPGSIWKITVNGSILISYDDGAENDHVTDTSITANLRSGIYTNVNQNGDDFEAGDLPADSDQTIWQLNNLDTPATGDLMLAVDDPAGTPITKKMTLANFGTLTASNVVVQVKTVGSGTYTPTATMKKVLVIGVGGGGGGAGGINTDSAGGGGGGGGTVIVLLTAAQIGASKAYVVGALGAATSNGTATTLDTAGALLNAGGGLAGTAGAASSGTLGTQAAGGAGGTAANGDLNIPGEPGERGIIYDGTNGSGGKGGSSVFGFGGAESIINTAGNAGTNYGGGGGGGHAGAASDRVGASGANGILYFIEFLS